MKLRDIARAAGVSLTAVSLVLNEKPGVGAEKRAQIQALLRENGYVIHAPEKPEAPVRNVCFLKYSRHSYLVNGNPGFVTQIIDAAEKECRRHGYNLMITAFSDPDSIDLPALLEKPATAGVLLLGTELEDEDMAFFSRISKPLVVVDNAVWGFPVSAVTMHNWDSIARVVEHLHSLGHRDIGFLYNSIPSSNDRDRRAAFEDSLRNLALPFSEDRVYPIFPTMDGARAAMLNCIDRGSGSRRSSPSPASTAFPSPRSATRPSPPWPSPARISATGRCRSSTRRSRAGPTPPAGSSWGRRCWSGAAPGRARRPRSNKGKR